MAPLTIGRTHDVNDDGSKTTGTIRDAAWKEEIYDQIDALLDGTSTFRLGGAIGLGEFSTTAIGTQNDWDIDTDAAVGNGKAVGILRCNNASDLTITGFKAPTDTRLMFVYAVGAGGVTLNHQDAGSTTAADRIITATGSALTLTAGSGSALLQYDATTARWRVLALAGSGGGSAPTNATTTATGTQNDFAPSGLTFTAGQTTTLRCNNATLLTINGVAGGVDGALLRIVSVGAGQVTLAHQNAGSTAANRLLNIITSGITPLAAGVGVATLLYDGTTARWRLVRHDQGAPIDVAYNASDFTSASTWTVDSGDVNRHSYMVRGREVTEYLEIVTSSVGASPGSALMSLIPNGWSASGRGFSTNMYNDGAGYVMGASWISSTDLTHLRHFKSDFSSAWSATTNLTYLYVTMTYWIS